MDVCEVFLMAGFAKSFQMVNNSKQSDIIVNGMITSIGAWTYPIPSIRSFVENRKSGHTPVSTIMATIAANTESAHAQMIAIVG